MKLFHNLLGFWTLCHRESMRFLKVYVQTLVSPILSNILFLGVFGGVFASRGAAIGSGDEYLPFLVPGLCIMGAVTAAFMNPSSSLMIQKYQGIHQDLNAFPMTDQEKTLAFVLVGALRGLLVGALTYVATIPFVGYAIVHPVGFFVLLAVVSFIFSAIGLCLGLYAPTFDSINFVQTIVIMPLLYFSGVFFQVSSLPGTIGSFAKWNPFFPLVDAVRRMYLGSGEGDLTVQIYVISVLTIVSYSIAYIMMRRGVGLRT